MVASVPMVHTSIHSPKRHRNDVKKYQRPCHSFTFYHHHRIPKLRKQPSICFPIYRPHITSRDAPTLNQICTTPQVAASFTSPTFCGGSSIKLGTSSTMKLGVPSANEPNPSNSASLPTPPAPHPAPPHPPPRANHRTD
ncbi:hypothetical protein DID88_008840 [Monilinia fructigena]|uniref:Uncharacterized protein n=1 Tax=Monilinia fructigena TaxID=38457 RepID=A0A395J7K4_9HELO|nr:hypothetical protein DID88_008840 [Monilinia fructigena]